MQPLNSIVCSKPAIISQPWTEDENFSRPLSDQIQEFKKGRQTRERDFNSVSLFVFHTRQSAELIQTCVSSAEKGITFIIFIDTY